MTCFVGSGETEVSMEPKLIRVQNPRAFLVPEFNAFIAEALSTSPFIGDPQQAIFELVNYVENPRMALYIAIEGIEITGMVLAQCSGSTFSPGCRALHFYNGGSAETRKLLISGLADFARSYGETSIWGVDTNKKPRGFGKLFRALGPSTRRGEVFEFDLSEAE